MDEATTTAPTIDSSLLDKLLSNQLSEADARSFALGDPECLVFTLLAIQQRLANTSQTIGPNTPSAAISPFAVTGRLRRDHLWAPLVPFEIGGLGSGGFA
ncbi:hypothetical protein Poly51_12920 [Rubripirellula tenax]|uniref:Uncharacterized protein n=1 Tax=Rubripirellula tenax TaxID=2528015 RepID=A0A5C6F9T7_9BACT|nr:hypothetical protein [Rubripirellula tenax]TWU58513.1 hypothetical protein Poly51_12920 [Rubripirellula tenax]